MDFSILLFLAGLVAFDISLLRRYSEENFKKHIEVKSNRSYLLLLLLLLFSFFIDMSGYFLAIILALGILPFYLIRRRNFFKSLDQNLNQKNNSFIYLSDAIGVILTWFYCWMSALIVIAGLWKIMGGKPTKFEELVLSAMISTGVILIVVRKAARRFGGGSFWRDIECVVQGKSFLRVFVIPVITGLIFAALSTYLMLNRSVQPQTPLGDLIQSAGSSFFMVIFIMLALMVAPFIEEVVFRGYFFRIVEKLTNVKVAVILIGLFFGLLHFEQYWGDWAALYMVSCLGLILTMLRAWSGTVVAGIVMHYIYNISVVLLPVIIIIISNPSYTKYTIFYDKYNSAEKEFLLKESIQKHPEFSDAYNDLAWLYATEKKNLNYALKLINVALKNEPENSAYLDTKAEVLEKKGMLEESLIIRRNLLKKSIPPSFKLHQKNKIELIKKSINSRVKS